MSAILSADDLNDFISPGVACIKPVETLPAAAPPTDVSLEHEVILDGTPAAVAAAKANAPAEISLTDCLACSGCVTSAEAVLVSLQSHSEVLSVLDSAPGLQIHQDGASGKWSVDGLENPDAKLFVASVSPQARANLAAAVGGRIGEQAAGDMISHLFSGSDGLRAGGKHGNGFTWVADTNATREACLVLGAEEALGEALGDNKASKPILSASCPGWVCYAEKTHPHVLPHLSRVKSPQALMGTLVKTTLSRVLGIAPDRIWHLAVMPCFDKKLEASREELTDSVWAGDGKPGRGVRDVDCVITSKEILMLTESRGIDFFGLPQTPLPQAQRTPFPDSVIQQFLFPSHRRRQTDSSAGTSGGNLYYALQYVSAQNSGSKIETVRGRNADVVEYSVVSAAGQPIFKAARYYGFRNIQNLVRRLKPARPSRMPGGKPVGGSRKQLEYAYVEVMACPGGCTNGGGQVKIDDPVVVERKGIVSKAGPQEQKDWLAEVDEAYFSAEEPESGAKETTADLVGGISPSKIRDTLSHWASMTGIDANRLVSTTYREVISDVGKDKSTDTEKVVQLASKIGGGW
ncbi:iron only hydrogenase large subunit domain-containing protein [Apiospora sp. TS-2023a]